MYDYVKDKTFLRGIRSFGGRIMQNVCCCLKKDYNISAMFYLVGSGARNLILQNENNPIDLDYNLEIVKVKDYNDCRYIKECVKKTFNKVLNQNSLRDCEDSTSSLTSKKIYYDDEKFYDYEQSYCRFANCHNPIFSIDVCIVRRHTDNSYFRLIHKKTGWVSNDEYKWELAPNSSKIKVKLDYIKKSGKWNLVREQYKKIKNNYLVQNDHTHSSFICYIEAVNNVYNSKKNWK